MAKALDDDPLGRKVLLLSIPGPRPTPDPSGRAAAACGPRQAPRLPARARGGVGGRGKLKRAEDPCVFKASPTPVPLRRRALPQRPPPAPYEPRRLRRSRAEPRASASRRTGRPQTRVGGRGVKKTKTPVRSRPSRGHRLGRRTDSRPQEVRVRRQELINKLLPRTGSPSTGPVNKAQWHRGRGVVEDPIFPFYLTQKVNSWLSYSGTLIK